MQDSIAKPTKVSSIQFQVQDLKLTAGEYRGKGKVKEKMREERALQMRRCDLGLMFLEGIHTHLINSRLGPPDSFDYQ